MKDTAGKERGRNGKAGWVRMPAAVRRDGFRREMDRSEGSSSISCYPDSVTLNVTGAMTDDSGSGEMTDDSGRGEKDR